MKITYIQCITHGNDVDVTDMTLDAIGNWILEHTQKQLDTRCIMRFVLDDATVIRPMDIRLLIGFDLLVGF